MNFDFPFSYQLDHIGIAVHSIEEGAPFYRKLGFSEPKVDEVPTESVKVAMFELGNHSKIELLEPMSEESPIAKFLEKKGPGIHHICFRVEDLDQVVAKIQQTDIRLLNEVPKPGAHGTRVVFIHPKSAGGVLVELNQLPEGEH